MIVDADPSSLRRTKCEWDYAGGRPTLSYSALTRLTEEAPKTGVEFYQRLNKSQRQLLTLSNYSVDWSKVKRVADIRSTDWTIRKQPPFDKLALELWKWPGGSVLELSTKTDAAALQSAFEQLRAFAVGKGLALNGTQQFKTELVLKR